VGLLHQLLHGGPIELRELVAQPFDNGGDALSFFVGIHVKSLRGVDVTVNLVFTVPLPYGNPRPCSRSINPLPIRSGQSVRIVRSRGAF
jgi:hypothetical protein